MRNLWLWLVLLAPAGAEDLQLLHDNKLLASYSLQQLKGKLPTRTLKLDGGKRSYWVLPLQPLLQQVYGAKPYGADVTYVFGCKDGYRCPVKASDLQKFPAYLAFASSDNKPFKEKNDALGPYYLVWDTNRFPQRTHDGPWPYQVTSIERTSFSRTYSAVVPPPNSSKQVARGFTHFRRYCLACHQINGQGGDRAIDLNSPVSVTEYIREPYLVRLIDNPQKVRHRATMPPLDPGMANREQAIQDIVAYLKAKAQQRRAGSAGKPPKPAK